MQLSYERGLPWWLSGKESTCNAADMGSIPGLGRFPLEKGMATHSSSLAWRIPRDRGAWRTTVHRVAETDTTERLTLSLYFSITRKHFTHMWTIYPILTD